MRLIFQTYVIARSISDEAISKEEQKINYYVYIMSNKTNSVVYTGVTNNLLRRVYEHKNNLVPNSFTSKYNIHKLVYFETTNDI